MERLAESLFLLVERASTVLPLDVRRALGDAARRDAADSRSGLALRAIALNVDSACDRGVPLCQDTGTLTFEVRLPPGVDQLLVAERIGRYARLVGRENVIAGTDCGFGTWVGQAAVDPDIVWAKLASLAEGARLASKELW